MGGMFKSCAHGVGSVAFSRGLSEPLFNGHGKPLSFAGRAEAVPGEIGGLERGRVFGAGLPKDGLVPDDAFHYKIHWMINFIIRYGMAVGQEFFIRLIFTPLERYHVS